MASEPALVPGVIVGTGGLRQEPHYWGFSGMLHVPVKPWTVVWRCEHVHRTVSEAEACAVYHSEGEEISSPVRVRGKDDRQANASSVSRVWRVGQDEVLSALGISVPAGTEVEFLGSPGRLVVRAKWQEQS